MTTSPNSAPAVQSRPPSLPIEVLRLNHELGVNRISGELVLQYDEGRIVTDRIKFRIDARKLLTLLPT